MSTQATNQTRMAGPSRRMGKAREKKFRLVLQGAAALAAYGGCAIEYLF